MFLDAQIAFIIFTVFGISCIFGLWLYYDHRDRNLYQAQRERAVFHCVRCRHLYSSTKAQYDVSCPKCNLKNDHLQF